MVKNKIRLVAKSFNQEEGINYEETIALVTRLEVIRILLTSNNLKLFQIDVKRDFLNGFISEEVYVEQPPDLKMIISLIICLID